MFKKLFHLHGSPKRERKNKEESKPSTENDNQHTNKEKLSRSLGLSNKRYDSPGNDIILPPPSVNNIPPPPKQITIAPSIDILPPPWEPDPIQIPPAALPPPPTSSVPPPPPPLVPPPAGVAKQPQTGLPNSLKPTKKLKGLNWSKIPAANIRANSIWNCSEDAFDNDQVEKLLTSLESNFSSSSFHKPISPRSRGTSPGSISLLDMKRSNNIAIVRHQIKLTDEEIRNAIENGDASKLTLQQLNALHKYAPNAEEVELFNSYDGDVQTLPTGEQFFKLMTEISQFEFKLRAMKFMKEFPMKIQELTPQINTLIQAGSEVINSEKLKKLFKLILLVGNILNYGKSFGGAEAFKIDALLKLEDTKASSSSKRNLVHTLVQWIEQEDSSLISVRLEIPHLKRAAELSVSNLSAAVKKNQEELENLKNELYNDSSLITQEKGLFRPILGKFLVKAENELKDTTQSLSKLESKCTEVVEYFSEDATKMSVTDVFTILDQFIENLEKLYQDVEKEKVNIQNRKSRMLNRQKSIGTDMLHNFTVGNLENVFSDKMLLSSNKDAKLNIASDPILHRSKSFHPCVNDIRKR